MKPESGPSCSSLTDDDDDQKNMKILLEAFGSAVSLENIGSAYCQSGRNLNSTVEKLCDMQGSIAGASFPKSEEEAEKSVGASSGSFSSCIPKKGSKKFSASMGTVSNVIGKGYFNRMPQSKGLDDKLKPPRLNSNGFPVTDIWGEEKELPLSTESPPMDSDLGEFMYKMLGEGFQLEKGLIQEVIGQCGYNMPMSIDKLLDISDANLEKSDDVIGQAAGNNTKKSHDVGSISCSKRSQLHYSESDAGRGDESILHETEMKREDMQREVLEALFSVPDRFQDYHDSTSAVRTHRQSPYGRIVAKPLKESIIEDFTFITRRPINDINNEANEEDYDELCKAAKENWATMKEYYKASVDAFIKGDSETAQNLLEQGNFFMRKAREAEEKSTQNLTGNSNKDEEFCINLHQLEPKEALYQLKHLLTSLCGSPSVRFMKIVVGTGKDKKDGRRKRLITKLLGKDGIPWTEEGHGWIVCLRVDEIDPIKFNFLNK